MDLTDVAPSVLGSSAKQWSARLVSRIALVAKASRKKGTRIEKEAR